MPLYEYTCLDCRQTFEVLKKFSEADEPVACLHCESTNTVRHLPVFVVHSSGRISSGTESGGACACGAGGCGCH